MLSRRISCFAAFFLALVLASAAASAPQSSDRLQVNSGDKLVVALETAVNTTTAQVGDRVLFRTMRDIMSDGKTAIPKGSLIEGTVTRVKSAQNAKRAEIEFRLDALKFDDGTSIPISAQTFQTKGDDSGGGAKNVLNVVITQGLGQAAQGAVLGGLFGGRKAAGIGAALGVGATVLSQTLLQPKIPGPELDLSQGTVFESKLKKTLNIPARLASLPPPSLPASGLGASPVDIAGNLGQPSANDPILGPTRENPSRQQPILNGPSNNQPIVPILVPEPNSPDSAVPVPVFSDATPAVAVPAQPADTVGGVPVDAPSSDALPSFTLSVNVNLAQVDALVRDRSGRPINNLSIGDFRLFEDGIEKPIQTFSKDELPLAVALVIDRSGSVAPSMGRIQSAAYQALSQLKAGDSVCLFSFAGDIQMLEPLTTDRQRVANRIGSIGAGGGTDIVDALFDAMSYLEEAAFDRRRAIILISDNQDVGGSVSVPQLVQLAHRSETVVYSVKIDTGGFVLPSIIPRTPSPFGGNPVPEITRQSGGEIFDVASIGSIDKAMATAVGRLKVRYTLGYSPTDDTREAHRIEIRLADRFGRPDSDYTVLSRTESYASSRSSRNSSSPRRRP
ncbi:MAG TPA: VWA domain-containing protein [Terriglobia bacterium]|nr:VWA domain-containing protein [Terriglobia bacterium]